MGGQTLTGARTEADGESAYNVLIAVLMHDHSGTVYDTAVPAAPLLARVAEQFTGVPRAVALSVLLDLMAFGDAGEIRSAVAGLEPLLRTLSAGRLNKPIPAAAHGLLTELGRR